MSNNILHPIPSVGTVIASLVFLGVISLIILEQLRVSLREHGLEVPKSISTCVVILILLGALYQMLPAAVITRL